MKIFKVSFRRKRKLVSKRIKEREEQQRIKDLFGCVLFCAGVYLMKDKN